VRRPLAVLALLVATAPAAAQPQPPEPIKLTLSPAGESSPALKFLLLPELSEQTPGNAVVEYYRAFSPEWWANVRKRDVMEKVEKVLTTPLAELKDSDVKWLMTLKALREVDRGARRAYCDWEMVPHLKEDGIYLQLPDVQAMREFGTFLAARARLEMAEGRLDQAVYTLQTGFALGRDVGNNGPTLVQALVGNAIANLMVAQLDELLRQPGAPNLYWALTGLPRPFIDLRKPLDGEKLWLFGTFPELRDVDDPHLSPRQRQRLQEIVGQFLSNKWEAGLAGPSDVATRLAVIAVVAKAYPAAKQALIAAGRKPAEVEALPALQVVLTEALRDYDRYRDNAFKWMALPYPQARPGLERAEKELKESMAPLEGIRIAQVMLPATIRVYAATTRLDRRLAALRCVEALRLYAAAHDGKLPATLDDIKDVPVPADPMTGKAFAYQVSGDTATLSAGVPPGEPAVPYNTLVYEVTLRK
jgi:hypothetical protein